MKSKVLTFLILLKALFCMEALFALDKPKADPKALIGLLQGKKNDIQAIYDNLPESVPAVILLDTDYKSGVPVKTINTFTEEIKKQMIENSLFKPVTMNKYLVSTYDSEKSKSIFSFIGDLKGRKYPANVKGVFKPMICKVAGDYIIKLTLYTFNGNGYPISAVRFVKSESEFSNAIKYSLLDLSKLLEKYNPSNIKVAVLPFNIKCKTLVEQKSGEFDFIATSFSNQQGVELKETDDYLSDLFAYQATCTGLLNACVTNMIPEYISTAFTEPSTFFGNSNYVVKSDVILSNQLNLISYNLYESASGKLIYTSKYFFEKLTVDEIWKINFKFIRECCSKIYTSNEIKFIDFILNDGKSYYMNGMFAGFGNISDIPVKTGKTIIFSGTKYASNISVNPESLKQKDNSDYFIYTNNNEVLIYKGREGEFVWNLLEK